MIDDEFLYGNWSSKCGKAVARPEAIAYHAAYEQVFEERNAQVSSETAYLGRMR